MSNPPAPMPDERTEPGGRPEPQLHGRPAPADEARPRGATARSSERSRLAGVIVVGIFAIGWGQWGASGLPKSTSPIVRILVIALGLMTVIRANQLRRSAADDADSTFPSREYITLVAAEVAALMVGAVVLGQVGEPAYIAPWIAWVVGVHFLVFARRFAWRDNFAGAGLIMAAAAGAITVAAGGGRHHGQAVTGLIAAAALLVTGAMRLSRARKAAH
ncbi:MAG: hypothetical protein JO130_18970 [Solirubrobacterales bacterium]|nr:hypothetical protein [Solirubrobacterales bacterium]